MHDIVSRMDTGKLLDELRIDRQSPEPPRRTPLIVGGVTLLLVLGAALVWWIVGNGQTFEGVEFATAAPPATQGSSATTVLQATGYVTARRQATVSALITGKLTEVLIEEGEHVKAGQVLARVEDTSQRAHLAEARAQLAQARAQIGQFESQYSQAQRDLKRQQELVDRKLVSQQALETARTQADALSAQLATQKEVVKLAEAQMGSAQVQLDYTTVRAPFAGVVVAKAAQVGEVVSPLSAGGGFTRTGIGTIVDMDSLEVEVDVNESYINRVQADGPAHAVLDAYPDWTIPAHVIAIIPTADRGKATVKVRIGLEKKDPRILPDMGARVSFLAAESANGEQGPALSGVLVPATAIVQRPGKDGADRSVVFVLEVDRVREHAVAAGQAFGDLRLVEGIAAGAKVVRTPPDTMRDGARIAL